MNAFLTIDWTKDDIAQVLEDNGLAASEEMINRFLANLDLKYIEEQCSLHGMEILNSKAQELLRMQPSGHCSWKEQQRGQA